jgi:hypothetical protein
MTAALASDSAASPAAGPRTLPDAARFFFGQASPRILAGALLAAAAVRLLVGSFTPFDLVPVVVIAAAWPLEEWLIHVYVLHQKPFTLLGRRFDLPVPRSHRAHHRDPWNLAILFIPTHTFLYTIPLSVGLSFLLTSSTGTALSAVVVILALGLHYEWVHFLAHTPYVPRTARYQRLVRHHRWHHFKNERFWYGVSTLSADPLLGTAPDPGEVDRSATVRSLGV